MSLLRRAGGMSAAVSMSRLLGLLREQVFAYLFGAGTYSDAFLVAFRIPNLLRDLFAEGAFSTAFVSVFSKQSNHTEQKNLAIRVCTSLVFILGILLVAMFFMAPWIVELLAGEFRQVPGKFELTVQLTRVLLPFLLFTSLAALSMGLLNSLGHFFVPALGSVAFNLSSVLVGAAAIFYLNSGHEQVWAFTLGTLCGGFLQWVVQWPLLKKNNFPVELGASNFFLPARLSESFSDPRLQRVLLVMAPSIVGVAALQINVVVNTSFAAALGEGRVSWLNYAYRLVHFPMGVFGVAISMASLPTLARQVADLAAFRESLSKAFRLMVILAVASAVGLSCLSLPIVGLIFEHGSFSAQDSVATAQALSLYTVGLIAFASNKIFQMAFYARESIRIPSLVSGASILSNFVFAYFFSAQLGFKGLALAVSLTSLLSMLVLATVLWSRKELLFDAALLKVLVVVAMGVLPMFAFRYFAFDQRIYQEISQGSTLQGALLLFSAIAALGLVYLLWVSLWLPEGRRLMERLRSRFLS